MRKSLPLFICALLLIGGATDAISQQFTGGIRGSVRDAQGIIPGVTVTLTNEGTTVARDTIRKRSRVANTQRHEYRDDHQGPNLGAAPARVNTYVMSSWDAPISRPSSGT